MKKNKGNILIQSIGFLIKGIWKLLLLGIYAIAKLIEVAAQFISQITDSLIKPK